MPTKPVNLKPYGEEVERGLSNERPRLNHAVMARAFYDYEGRRYSTLFTRDAETTFDFLGRPYRPSGFTREVVDVLTEHLYCPGPQRTWTDAAGQELLDRVYADNHIDALMLRCDQLSTLADVVAIQVDAREGQFNDKPITLTLWEAGEFAAWTDPDDCTKIVAVCTIDRHDQQTRYKLWSAEEVWIYQTKKADGTSGGRVATLQSRLKHDYGCIPFSFYHYEQPIQSFWSTGISELVVNAEIRINDRLSRLDEAINKHLNPLAIAKNADDKFNPTVEPQRFIRLNSARMRPGPSGGFESGPDPELSYLQATIDVAGAWDDLLKYINQVLEAVRVPASAIRMEQTGIQSGIALIVEQAPLLTRARRRRYPASIYETNLAKTILTCAGNHYGKQQLANSAKSGRLVTAWPKPSVPVPTTDALELGLGEVQAGLKSLLGLIQDWYGVTRDQALELAKQISKDNADLTKINPDLFKAGNAAEDETENDEQDQGDGEGHAGDEVPTRGDGSAGMVADAGKDE
jgi:hypothetical protein